MAFYDDILNGLTRAPQEQVPAFGALSVPMKAGGPQPQMQPAMAQPAQLMPETGGFDDLATFLAGMGEGGGALLPALGSGMRAVSAEKERRGRVNETYNFLVKKGMDTDTAKAVMGNPELLKLELSKIYKPEPQAPVGYAMNPDGTMRYIPGGPQDPATMEAQAKAKAVSAAQKPTASQVVIEREALAKQYGLDVNSDAGRAFILTGKLPREDQQMLTATDKKAILEADEMVQTNEGAIKALREAQELSKKANQGWFAGARASIANNLPDIVVPDIISSPESAAATSGLDNAVIGTALAQLKSIFGAAPTEGERKILLELQGASSQPDRVRQDIYARAIAAAEKRLSFNRQRAKQMRSGTFYKPQGGGQQPAPGGMGGAPIRAKNAQGQVIEFNGSEWVPVQ